MSDSEESSDAAPAAAEAEAAEAQLAAMPPRRAGRITAVLAGLAVLLALAALALGALLWSGLDAQSTALDAAAQRSDTAIDRIEMRLAAVDAATAELERGLSEAARQREQLAERAAATPSRLAELERSIDAQQGGSLAARQHWLRAEAEHYLLVANTALDLDGDFDRAATALELADARLRALTDPALAGVREAIAGELQALAAVRLPDIDGLAYSLARAAGRIDSLPLAGNAPDSIETEAAPDAAEPPGVGRLWASVRRALGGLIRVERRDVPVAAMLTATERRLLRREATVQLELAQVALVRGEPGVFRASIESAERVLERDFDTRDPAVEGVLALLADMAAIDIAPARPDISGSLARLRAAGSD